MAVQYSKPTMQQIAQAAGVSQAAVSMALRNHARISKATCKRIQGLAKEMGYRPDPLISTLMTQRRTRNATSTQVCLAIISLWPDKSEAWENSEFYKPYREGIEQRAEALSYRTEIYPCDGSAKEVNCLLRILNVRGIQGIIFCQAHESITNIPFPLDSFASVLIGPGIREPNISRVDSALDYDIHLAWQRLLDAGRKRIGLVTHSIFTHKTRGAAMGAYLNLQRRLIDKDCLAPLELGKTDDLQSISEWIQATRPDAILTERADVAEELSRVYPQLDVVCFALSDGQAGRGIRVERKEIGMAAVDIVVAQLNQGERGIPAVPKRLLIEGHWQD